MRTQGPRRARRARREGAEAQGLGGYKCHGKWQKFYVAKLNKHWALARERRRENLEEFGLLPAAKLLDNTREMLLLAQKELNNSFI